MFCIKAENQRSQYWTLRNTDIHFCIPRGIGFNVHIDIYEWEKILANQGLRRTVHSHFAHDSEEWHNSLCSVLLKNLKIHAVIPCDHPLPTIRSQFSTVQSLCRDGVYKPTLMVLQDYVIQCGRGLSAEMIGKISKKKLLLLGLNHKIC